MRDDKGEQEGLAECFLINFQFSILNYLVSLHSN